MKNLIALLIMLSLISTCKQRQRFADNEMFVRAQSGLLLRTAPSKDGAVLVLIPNDAKVILTETEDYASKLKKNTWLKVNYLTHQGYVYSGYLASRPSSHASSEKDLLGHWKGDQSCNDGTSGLELRPNGFFEAKLFGGGDMGTCEWFTINGSYTVNVDEICLFQPQDPLPRMVPSKLYPEEMVEVIDSRNRNERCYELANGTLKSISGTGFMENYHSQPMDNLTR